MEGWNGRELGELVEEVRGWEGKEGVVVHWEGCWGVRGEREREREGGEGDIPVDFMLKIKSDWYVSNANASKLAG